MQKIIDPDDITILPQSEEFFVGPIHSIIVGATSIKMRWILDHARTLQLTDRVKLVKSFPVATKAFTTNIAIVDDNIAVQIQFLHNLLFLRTIFFDKVLEHLMCPK